VAGEIPLGEHPLDDLADAMGGFPMKRPAAHVPVNPEKIGCLVGESPLLVSEAILVHKPVIRATNLLTTPNLVLVTKGLCGKASVANLGVVSFGAPGSPRETVLRLAVASATSLFLGIAQDPRSSPPSTTFAELMRGSLGNLSSVIPTLWYPRASSGTLM
jgi:hypothetical protein